METENDNGINTFLSKTNAINIIIKVSLIVKIIKLLLTFISSHVL